MRADCSTCQTRHSIPDERIAGRRVAFRCKKCGARMVVSGGPAGGAVTGDESVGLRGERNESSVLFTLANLARLDARASAPAVTAAPQAAGDSGLLDMRNLVRSYPPARPARPSAAQALELFDLAQPPPLALFPPAAAPPRTDRRLLLVLGGLIAGLAAATVLLAVVALRDKPSQPAAVIDPPPTQALPALVAPPAAPPAPAVAPAAPPVAQSSPPAAPATAPAIAPPATREPHQRVPRRPPPPPKALTAVDCMLMDHPPVECRALLDDPPATPRPGTPVTTTTETPDPSLPDRLDTAVINREMAAARDRIAQCSTGRGTVTVRVRVAASGAVSGVEVLSSSDPALGRCAVTAVERAHLDRTQKGGRFDYAFSVR